MSLVLAEKELNTRGEMEEYLRTIRQFPRLTPEEERSLALRCAAGDEDAIRTMVTANLGLVFRVVREYSGRGVSVLDLAQEGSIGLLKAARKFDPSLNFRFSTYADTWIRREVSRYLLNHGSVIRVPIAISEKARKILRARTVLQQQTGEMPTDAELAAYCEMSVEKMQECLQRVPEICSLDALVGEEGDATLQLLLEDVQTPQPQEEIVRQELRQLLSGLLGQLTERQQQVLRLRYGLDDGRLRSYEQTAEALGISKERARQLEKAAMDKLRPMSEKLGLEDFLE